MVLLVIAFLEEKESDEKLGMIKNGLVSTFLFPDELNSEKCHLSSPITTKASKIMFSAETGLSETLLGPG